jgi:hypothetical protein
MEFRALHKSNTVGPANLWAKKPCDFLKILYKLIRRPRIAIRVAFKTQVEARPQGEKPLNEGTLKHPNLYQFVKSHSWGKAEHMQICCSFMYIGQRLQLCYILKSNQVKSCLNLNTYIISYNFDFKKYDLTPCSFLRRETNLHLLALLTYLLTYGAEPFLRSH